MADSWNPGYSTLAAKEKTLLPITHYGTGIVVENGVERRFKRRNAWFWRFKQRFKHRNVSGFGVFDIYEESIA